MVCYCWLLKRKRSATKSLCGVFVENGRSGVALGGQGWGGGVGFSFCSARGSTGSAQLCCKYTAKTIYFLMPMSHNWKAHGEQGSGGDACGMCVIFFFFFFFFQRFAEARKCVVKATVGFCWLVAIFLSAKCVVKTTVGCCWLIAIFVSARHLKEAKTKTGEEE